MGDWRAECASHAMVRTGVTQQDFERERQQLVELAVNESNSAVYVADATAKILFINKTFTSMLGYEPGEVIGRRARDVFGSEHYTDKDYARIWADFSRGRSIHEEVRSHDKHGREVWLTLLLRPVLDAAGKLTNMIGFLENTTESRQIQSLQRDVLEAVAQEMPLADVMTMICHRVEVMFPEVVSSILAVDSEQRLRPLAAPSLPVYTAKPSTGWRLGRWPDRAAPAPGAARR